MSIERLDEPKDEFIPSMPNEDPIPFLPQNITSPLNKVDDQPIIAPPLAPPPVDRPILQRPDHSSKT